MISYTFIVNPAAGKGAGERITRPLRVILEAFKMPYELVLTERVGHATVLARTASGEVVVGVGGDGTLNEIVNGLMGTGKALGIVPAGSGNDFIRSVGIPRGLARAVEKLRSGLRRLVDVGSVRCLGATGPDSDEFQKPRWFLNGVGVGFDAAVAARIKEIRYLRGTPLYMAAVFQTLGRYQNPRLTVDIDGDHREGRHLLIAIGNGTCAGGGFYLTPRASVSDGLLDFCLIGDVGKLRILRLMPLVLWGKHVSKEGVNYVRGRNIVISSEDRFHVHADGEIVGRGVTRVEVGLLDEKLPVIF